MDVSRPRALAFRTSRLFKVVPLVKVLNIALQYNRFSRSRYYDFEKLKSNISRDETGQPFAVLKYVQRKRSLRIKGQSARNQVCNVNNHPFQVRHDLP